MELNIRKQYIQDIYKIVRDKNIDLHILKCNFEGWCLDEIKQLKYLLLS